ncbi:MAG: CBS domain-containing protein [Acetobacteraceae bacterium]
MAQTPDTKIVTPDHVTQSGVPAPVERKVQAAVGQAVASENALLTGMQATARQGADTTQQVGGQVGETVRRTAEAGTEAARLTAQVGAETGRRGVETLAKGSRSLAEDMAHQFERMTQQIARTVQDTTLDLRSFVVPPQGAGENLRDLQEGISGLVSGVVQSNMRMTQQLLQMTDPGRVFDLQRRFMRDYMDALLTGTGAIVRVARRTADQTLQPVEQRIAQHREYQRQPVVSDVMSADVQTVTPEDTVHHATRLMRDSDSGVLPVGEGDRLVGVVTDRDVTLRVVAEGKDPQRTKVREVMSTEPKYVFEDETLEHVADNMAQQQIRRLPVVSRAKRLVGIVSLGDLARADHAGHFAGKAMRGVVRAGGTSEARSIAAE